MLCHVDKELAGCVPLGPAGWLAAPEFPRLVSPWDGGPCGVELGHLSLLIEFGHLQIVSTRIGRFQACKMTNRAQLSQERPAICCDELPLGRCASQLNALYTFTKGCHKRTRGRWRSSSRSIRSSVCVSVIGKSPQSISQLRVDNMQNASDNKAATIDHWCGGINTINDRLCGNQRKQDRAKPNNHYLWIDKAKQCPE